MQLYPPHPAALDQLLTTHEDRLRQLLGYWPVVVWKTDQFGPLTKYTLGPMPDGRWVMLHHLTAPDSGEAHDHPCQMESHGIQGSYVERVYYPNQEPRDVVRAAGSSHLITPDCIHRLIELPEGDCWTLCFAGPVVRQWRHYSEEELRAKSSHSTFQPA